MVTGRRERCSLIKLAQATWLMTGFLVVSACTSAPPAHPAGVSPSPPSAPTPARAVAGLRLFMPVDATSASDADNQAGSTSWTGVEGHAVETASGVLLCTIGGRVPAQITSVGLLNPAGLSVTAFGIQPLPQPGGKYFGGGDYPLSHYGFITSGRRLVSPCHANWESIFPGTNRATANLAVSVRLAGGALTGTATGLRLSYRPANARGTARNFYIGYRITLCARGGQSCPSG